jgi:hypothetical protein
MREKINAKVLFDEDGWAKLQAEVPKVYFLFIYAISTSFHWIRPVIYMSTNFCTHFHHPHLHFFSPIFYFYRRIFCLQMKLVTPSALVERLKINASLARAACKFLAEVRYGGSKECVGRKKMGELVVNFCCDFMFQFFLARFKLTFDLIIFIRLPLSALFPFFRRARSRPWRSTTSS